ncbi:MAG: hypothetical protein SGILL_009945, partial [Bacillariaceae sp.]
ERDVVKKARMESQKIARRNTRSKEKETKEGVVATNEESLIVNSTMPTMVFGKAEGAEDDDSSDFSPEPADAPGRGSFDQVTTKTGGDDSAAAAAAEWAIERKLTELMTEDQLNQEAEDIHRIV